jgi:hypothetical protein
MDRVGLEFQGGDMALVLAPSMDFLAFYCVSHFRMEI